MEKRFDSQRKQIMDWLQEGHYITPIIALEKWGAFRLSAIIHRLRNQYGMPIVTEMVYEGNKSYAKYYLKKEA